MKILVADDSPSVQDVFDLLINHWGYEADIVSDGRKALLKAKTNLYDLCVLDIDMPDLNGLETTLAIRRSCSFVPILAVTSKERNIRNRCFVLGVNDFLQKPFELKDLYGKINELTVKTIVIKKEEDKIKIEKERPMNAEHLKELKELEKRNLSKISLRGALTEINLVVHKNVPQKISHDFIGEDKELSIFLDRSDDKPGECYLYRRNFFMNTRFLTGEKFEGLSVKEEERLKNCNTFAENKKEEV